MLNITYQHPLPGATYEVISTTMYWSVGELKCVALLRAEDGSLIAASQPSALYHDSPARLYDREGHYRNSADRAPMTEGARVGMRFTMDWSTASAPLNPDVEALFVAALET